MALIIGMSTVIAAVVVLDSSLFYQNSKFALLELPNVSNHHSHLSEDSNLALYFLMSERRYFCNFKNHDNNIHKITHLLSCYRSTCSGHISREKSHGTHSQSVIAAFGGNVTLECKVNPKDSVFWFLTTPNNADTERVFVKNTHSKSTYSRPIELTAESEDNNI